MHSFQNKLINFVTILCRHYIVLPNKIDIYNDLNQYDQMNVTIRKSLKKIIMIYNENILFLSAIYCTFIL
jgi:hypothetical protein